MKVSDEKKCKSIYDKVFKVISKTRSVKYGSALPLVPSALEKNPVKYGEGICIEVTPYAIYIAGYADSGYTETNAKIKEGTKLHEWAMGEIEEWLKRAS